MKKYKQDIAQYVAKKKFYNPIMRVMILFLGTSYPHETPKISIFCVNRSKSGKLYLKKIPCKCLTCKP